MPAPKKDNVQRLLKPREPILGEIVLNAWERWQRNPERAQLYRRTRATLIHNYMMLDAIPRLRESDGFYVAEKHETALFLVDNQLILRFKKGDMNGLSSNIPTQTALAFNDPDEDLSLFAELPPVGRADIVYVLNLLETAIQSVSIVARDEDRIIWQYSIYSAGGEQSEPVQLPTMPQEPGPADRDMRVPGSEEKDDEAKKAGE